MRSSVLPSLDVSSYTLIKTELPHLVLLKIPGWAFILQLIVTVPPPEIHLTAELCSCIVRAPSIHFLWQTTLPKNTLCQLGRRTEDVLFHFLDHIHIITTLTLLTTTFLLCYLSHMASLLRHSVQFLKVWEQMDDWISDHAQQCLELSSRLC